MTNYIADDTITREGFNDQGMEEIPQGLCKELRTKCDGKIIRKTIPFTNDDVPRYLARLDAFEERSRRARIVVR